MNYYPFHIGDFAAHTSHLTWEEDIAYRRMLDVYYLGESALPLDQKKIARLIRMPKSLSAIGVVLSEFFIESDDGWHNKRADDELSAMEAKKEQQATKDEHEADRMRRYRERRSEMFKALRDVGVVPAWDIPMKNLQQLFSDNCNAPATHLQREQEITSNEPATAIPTPTPTPTPDIKTKRAPRFDALAHLVEFGVDPNIASDWIKLRRAKRAEVTRTAIDGICNEAAKAGFSLDAALRECCSRGWAGFKADWIRPSAQAAPAFKSVADQRKEFMDALTGRSPQPDALPFIDGESRHVA